MVFAFHAPIDGGVAEPLKAGLRNGVAVFFVLSGFLLFRPFLAGSVSPLAYAARRILRIWPAYAAAVIGIAIATGNHDVLERPLAYLTMFQTNLSIAWTLQIEVVFYVTVPLVALLVARRSMWMQLVAVGSLCLISVGAVIADRGAPSWDVANAAVRYWEFVPGMIVAIVSVHRPDLLAIAARRPVIASAVALLTLGAFLGLDQYDVPSVIGSALLVSAIVARPSVSRFPRLVATAGALSYAVYLWHDSVVMLVRTHGYWGPVAVALAAILTLAIASLSWIVIERPAIRFGARMRSSAIGLRPGSVAV
jgi:peptidoglycan/LPS O-acetylase OafA/YrhL